MPNPRIASSRVNAMMIMVTALAVALVWLYGAGDPAGRATAPFQRPAAPAKPFLAAPPLCGDTGFFTDFAPFADVTAPCPTGPVPGRYLSERGFVAKTPYAFTLPAGWTVSSMDALTDRPGSPGGNGLMVRSLRTGDGFVFTLAPIQADPIGRIQQPRDLTPYQLATWAATRPSLIGSPVSRTTLGGRPAWQVDLRLSPSTPHHGVCLMGEGCARVFEVWTSGPPQPRSLGVLPGRPVRALLFSSAAVGAGGVTLLVWAWGRTGSDDVADPGSQIRQVLDSLDFDVHLVGPDGIAL